MRRRVMGAGLAALLMAGIVVAPAQAAPSWVTVPQYNWTKVTGKGTVTLVYRGSSPSGASADLTQTANFTINGLSEKMEKNKGFVPKLGPMNTTFTMQILGSLSRDGQPWCQGEANLEHKSPTGQFTLVPLEPQAIVLKPGVYKNMTLVSSLTPMLFGDKWVPLNSNPDGTVPSGCPTVAVATEGPVTYTVTQRSYTVTSTGSATIADPDGIPQVLSWSWTLSAPRMGSVKVPASLVKKP